MDSGQSNMCLLRALLHNERKETVIFSYLLNQTWVVFFILIAKIIDRVQTVYQDCATLNVGCDDGGSLHHMVDLNKN